MKKYPDSEVRRFGIGFGFGIARLTAGLTRGYLTLIWKRIKYTEIQEFRCFFRIYSDEEASKIA